MTRAALVACVIAAAVATPLSVARGAPDATTSGSTFVVRGLLVQYIPPSGSIVGSLSLRVLSAGARGRTLLGELVTVAVKRGNRLKAGQLLPEKSICTVTLDARSPASILKGAAAVRTVVASSPGLEAQRVGTAPGDAGPGSSGTSGKGNQPAAASGGGVAASGDHSLAQSTDASGQGGGQGWGQSSGAGSEGQARAGDGSSNGHK